jgi:lambda repressor-like predicted transcriptional regulator
VELMAYRTKGPNGRFIRTVQTADRDRLCAELRGQGLTLDQIGEKVGLSKSATHEAIDRGLRGTPTLELVAAKALALAKLDAQERHFLAVQAKTWYGVDHGRVICDEDGSPMIDPDPGMRAGLALIRIAERRARLEGTDEPTRSRVEVLSEDVFTEAINNLNREMAALEVLDRANASDHSEAGNGSPVPGAAPSP